MILKSCVPRHIFDPGRFAFVGEGRVPGDDHQVLKAGQLGDEVLGDPVGEVLLLRIARHVVEGQDRDRRFRLRTGRCAGNNREISFKALTQARGHLVDSNRLLDVLDLLGAEVFEAHLDLVLHLVEDVAGYANTTGFRQPF